MVQSAVSSQWTIDWLSGS